MAVFVCTEVVFLALEQTSISKMQYRKTVSWAVNFGAGQCSLLLQRCILRGHQKAGCSYSKRFRDPQPGEVRVWLDKTVEDEGLVAYEKDCGRRRRGGAR